MIKPDAAPLASSAMPPVFPNHEFAALITPIPYMSHQEQVVFLLGF